MVDVKKDKHAGKPSAQRFRNAVMNALNLDMDDFETDDAATDYVLGLINSMTDNQIAVPKAKDAETVIVLRRPKLCDPTIDLAEKTFGYMLDRLVEFERRNPGLELGWMQPDWPKQCVDAIRRKIADGEYIDAMNYIMFAFAQGWPMAEALIDPEGVAPASARTWQYEFRNHKDSNDYSELVKVLHDALTQAAYGKGRERHANDLPFSQQPMQAISSMIDSPLGMVYQVCKKVCEGVNLPTHEQRVRELLGVINYTAGIVIWLNHQQPKD